jgi:hypothetical protein
MRWAEAIPCIERVTDNNVKAARAPGRPSTLKCDEIKFCGPSVIHFYPTGTLPPYPDRIFDALRHLLAGEVN